MLWTVKRDPKFRELPIYRALIVPLEKPYRNPCLENYPYALRCMPRTAAEEDTTRASSTTAAAEETPRV